MSRKTRMIQYLAKHNALDAAAIEKIMEMKDGGPGSGNFGHRGRPGKRGGSAKGEGAGGNGAGAGGYTKKEMELLNAGRKAFNKMYGLPESAEAYPAGGKPLSKIIGPEYLKAGQEIRIERPSGKNGIETEIFRRSKKNPDMFESEVRTPWGGNLGKSEVNLNYVNQVLSKAKPVEVEYRDTDYGGSSSTTSYKAFHRTNGEGLIKEPSKAVKKIFGNSKPVIGIRRVKDPRNGDQLLVSSLPYTGGERIMVPAMHNTSESAARAWCEANKIDPDQDDIEAIWNPDQASMGFAKSFKVGGNPKGIMKEPSMQQMEAEYWLKKGDSVDKRTKSDMSFAIGMMRGTDDPETKDLDKDLKWVNESKTRSEFIDRGEAVKHRWDQVIKNDPEYADHPQDIPWGNPYEEFKNCLENEMADQKSYEKAVSGSATMKEPPYGAAYGIKHGSLKRDAKSTDDALNQFRSMVSGKDQNAVQKECEKMLKDMAPGTAFRFDEKSKKGQYDWMIKQPDGSFLYTNKLDGSQTTLSAKDIASDIAIFADPAKALGEFSVPEKGASDNDAYWTAKRQFAQLKPNAGDRYTGKRVPRADSVKNFEKRAAGEPFPKEQGNASAEYTKIQRDAAGRLISAGKPVGVLTSGSGVTRIDRGDISQANPDDFVYNTLGEHCVEDANGNLVMTPEREELHQQIISDLFAKAKKPTNGKKVATFLGGGSAAGKGTIQGKESGVDFPGEDISPVIDADKLKESLPEYVDTAFSDDHEQAASYAHEESSALAKRAMQAAMANGYSYTLDGTGDGSLKSMKKKIDEARANGYEVNGVYCTCPTEKAVERSIGRSKTDKFGRLVKPETVRHIHEEVSRMFPDIAPMMDKCDLYDTDQGGKPVLIATCKRGGPIKVINPKLYQAFLDKAPKKESV